MDAGLLLEQLRCAEHVTVSGPGVRGPARHFAIAHVTRCCPTVPRRELQLACGLLEERGSGLEIRVHAHLGADSTAGVRAARANKERPMATSRPDPAATDPEVEGFLALLAARR